MLDRVAYVLDTTMVFVCGICVWCYNYRVAVTTVTLPIHQIVCVDVCACSCVRACVRAYVCGSCVCTCA